MTVEMGGLDDARMCVEVDPFDAMVSKCFHEKKCFSSLRLIWVEMLI